MPTRFFGRRHGRRLRPNRKALLTEILPAISVPLPAAGERLEPARLFDAPSRPAGGKAAREVWLEIGFGAGEHLQAQAAAHPEVGFLGCEPFVNGIAALLAAWPGDPRRNLRILADDARRLLPVLADASIARAFLLFPDPWPKTRHADRRFLGAGTVADLARSLADGAELRVATDWPLYARWTLTHVLACPDFAWTARRPADWRRPPADWVETRYQAKTAACGRPAIHLSFRRRPRHGRPSPP
jgi:tRNA (guanine-N7-)-methyltransferase